MIATTDIDVSSWFYDGWPYMLRVALMALLAYPTLIVMLRLSGKRTLSKMNAFDLTITIAFGSVLAAVILNKGVSYLEGVIAFAMLVGLQFSAAWLSVRSGRFRQLIKATPTILYWDDHYLDDVCRKERVARSEIRCAVRQAGLGEMQDVQAVILETTGDFTVIARQKVDADDPNAAAGTDRFSALVDPTNRPGNA